MRNLKKILLAFTYGERVLCIAALCSAVVSGSVLFGLKIAKSTVVVPAEGGEYSQGLQGQPSYINPVTASTEVDKSLVRLVYSNLESVAQKINASTDGRTWNIRLKENLRWQDGEKLTSDDVIFTVQKIQDPDANSPLYPRWQGVVVSRISEIELRFSLVAPYAFFEDNLKDLYILPKHLWADTPPSNWKLSEYNLKPVGNGPYQFLAYEKRPDGFVTDYHLAAWDKYFGDWPLIQYFNFNFASNDADMVQAFNAGQINALAGLDPTKLVQIKRPYEVVSFELPSYYAVFLNQSQNLPLKDAAVRQALSLAVDRNDLVLQVFGGRGEPDPGPIPPGAPYFDAGAVNQTSSLEIASATLEAAGWKMTPDGVRGKNIGNATLTLDFNLVVPRVDFLTRTADYLKQIWGQIGVKISPVVADTEDILGTTVKNREYEMLLFGNVLGPSSDLYSFWHSSERFYPGTNLALYNDKQADTLIESVRADLDPGKRRSDMSKLQSVIIGDSPAVFLYSPYYLFVADKGVHGVQSGFVPEPADIFRAAASWYLKTARVLK